MDGPKSEWAQIVTIFIATVTIYFSFRNQQRLKAFEIVLGRRDALLRDIQSRISFYLQKVSEMRTQDDVKNDALLDLVEYDEARALFHRMSSAGLDTANIAKMFGDVNDEYYSCPPGTLQSKIDHLLRKVNCLNFFASLLQIRIAEELHYLSTSRWERWQQRRKSEQRLAQDKAAMAQNKRDEDERQVRREELTRVAPTRIGV